MPLKGRSVTQTLAVLFDNNCLESSGLGFFWGLDEKDVGLDGADPHPSATELLCHQLKTVSKVSGPKPYRPYSKLHPPALKTRHENTSKYSSLYPNWASALTPDSRALALDLALNSNETEGLGLGASSLHWLGLGSFCFLGGGKTARDNCSL